MLFFVCALGVLACKKENLNSNLDAVTGRTVTISAQLPEDATKIAVAGDGKVTWTANDEIAVYNTAGAKFKFTVTGGAGTNYASFTCTSFEGEIGNVAAYPYDLAGDEPGKITIPAYMPLSAEPRPVMASKVTPVEGNLEAGSVSFKHIMGMVEFSLQDIPSYACALKIWCDGAKIQGDFEFDTDTIAPIVAPAEGNADDTYSIIFPYKTGYGAATVTKFYAPLPVKNYGGALKIRVLDGDNTVIENTGKTVPASYSNITAGKYLAMPAINVRAAVGTARDKFTKVQKVKWAKSNLRAMSVDAGAADKEGWQPSWGLYDNPWETQIGIVYPATTCSGDQKNNITLNQDWFKKGGYYSHFDYFSWGTIGRAARVHNAKVTSSVAEFDITGKVFRGTATTGGDISTFTELSGDDRFADESRLDGANSTLYGDLAFWASKGQYRMPKKEEITTLYTNASQLVKGRANLQAGYCKYRLEGDTQDRIMNGILYTTVPFYVSGGIPTNNTTAVEFTAADLESGVFFPKNGERTTNKTDGTYDATTTFAWNAWGVYWSGTYGGRNGSGYDDCARAIGWVASSATSYGYTLKLSNSIWGNTAIGNCIRPVLCE